VGFRERGKSLEVIVTGSLLPARAILLSALLWMALE